MNKCLWWLWELFCLTAFGTEGKDLIILLVLFPLLPPCTWVCRREWLRTWACSLLRSVTGLQVIKDVKNPTIFIWKSSSTRALRVLWPYKGAAGYRGAYIPNCRFVSCWWAWNVVQKAQNLLREEKDRREESGCRRTLCQWSSSSLARGCPFYRRSKYWKACAGIGEKRCQCQKGTKWKPIYDRQ